MSSSVDTRSKCVLQAIEACMAFSKPASGDPQTVSVAGLLVFAPEEMVDTEQGLAYLVSSRWIPVEIEDGWFQRFLERLGPSLNPQARDHEIRL